MEQLRGTMYTFATLGARTERGGYVTQATSRISINNLDVALVGDFVTYRDGSKAAIIDGSGKKIIHCSKCLALVGSHLDNGDKIVFAPWDDGKTGFFVPEGESIEGLFDSSYVPPPIA